MLKVGVHVGVSGADHLIQPVVGLEDGESRVAGMVPREHEKLNAAGVISYASFAEASNGVVVGAYSNKPHYPISLV
jgi:hypothetical protein